MFEARVAYTVHVFQQGDNGASVQEAEDVFQLGVSVHRKNKQTNPISAELYLFTNSIDSYM